MSKLTLPRVALIETGVVIRFLGDQPDDPRSPGCIGFCNRMIEGKRQLLIAAPSAAEIMRKRSQAIPLARGVQVVPFDMRAAKVFADKLTMDKIRQSQDATGCSLTYLKYDAMIAACALRWEAEVIIAIDGDHFKMASAIGIPVRSPLEYIQEPPRIQELSTIP